MMMMLISPATSMHLLLHLLYAAGDGVDDDVAVGVDVAPVLDVVPSHDGHLGVSPVSNSVMASWHSLEMMLSAQLVLEMMMISCHPAGCCYYCSLGHLPPLNILLADLLAGWPKMMMVTAVVEMGYSLWLRHDGGGQ